MTKRPGGDLVKNAFNQTYSAMHGNLYSTPLPTGKINQVDPKAALIVRPYDAKQPKAFYQFREGDSPPEEIFYHDPFNHK